MNDNKIFSKEVITKEVLRYIKKDVKKDNFIDWMHQNYDVLRCYHGCRPVDVQSYYTKGFLPANIEQMIITFDIMLENLQYPIQYDVRNVVETYTGSINKFIYFILNREDFSGRSPHYIIYGSEFMLSLAQKVNDRLKYHLRTIGIPTIFHCDIPLDAIREQDLFPIYERIMGAEGTFRQKIYQVFSNYSIIIPAHLESKYIVGHNHPTSEIYDAHAEDIYQNTISICPACHKFE